MGPREPVSVAGTSPRPPQAPRSRAAPTRRRTASGPGERGVRDTGARGLGSGLRRAPSRPQRTPAPRRNRSPARASASPQGRTSGTGTGATDPARHGQRQPRTESGSHPDLPALSGISGLSGLSGLDGLGNFGDLVGTAESMGSPAGHSPRGTAPSAPAPPGLPNVSRCTICTRSAGSKGFPRNASTPLSPPTTPPPSNSVHALTSASGRCLVRGSARSRSAVRTPSRRGITASSVTTSGRTRCTTSRHSAPSTAVTTSKPSSSRLTLINCRMTLLSSTTSTRPDIPGTSRSVGAPLHPRPGFAHFHPCSHPPAQRVPSHPQ